ncbi:MAG: aminotransferase class V-fold PLP-dependent enzyme [Candidatus Kapabacteria bacterium]|jgi:isopenicillin-N epimerase|nr:aminotransferase class V-fold PLP-dependent enzyme [Candidatus Kapabacteria bacterium]
MLKYGKHLLSLWNLNKDVVFLNNGSFGATPISILEAQNSYKYLLEKTPVTFMLEESEQILNTSRAKIANLTHADVNNICFVDNATSAVNSALHFLIFQKKLSGEIIYTNHTYPAIVNTLLYYEKYSDIKLRRIHIPFLTDHEEIIEIFRKSISSDTKVVLLDGVASTSSIIFPYDTLSEIFSENGIITIVDAAHGIGCTNLDLSNPKFDFYTSNNHKWLFSPKGSAFLYVSERFRDEIHPPIISMFYNSSMIREFEWQGTKDLSKWIASGDAVDFYLRYGGNEIIKHNTELIRDAKRLIISKFDTYSTNDSLNTSLATFFLSDKIKISPDITMKLRRHFLDNYSIELFFGIIEDAVFFRISAQIFNDLSDYMILCDALNDFRTKGFRI